MMLKEILDKTTQFFKDKKIPSARLDAEILLSHGLKLKNRMDLYLKFDQPVGEAELSVCRELVRRRSLHEPVAYIVGSKGFYNHTFKVTPAVLIPRPETELLVEQAFEWLEKNNITKPNVLDLGCGSGCIGLSILAKYPEGQLTMVDISADALAVAKENAEQMKLSNIRWKQADVGSVDFSDQLKNEFFDLILANPPYIDIQDSRVEATVKNFEPQTALFAPDQGLQFLKNWSQKMLSHLKQTSMMGFEMGCDQGTEMKNWFQSFNTFADVKVVKDLSSLDRHIIGVKNG